MVPTMADLTASVTDVNKAIDIVKASPYSRPIVSGGSSLSAIHPGKDFSKAQDKILSLNDKLAALESQTLSDDG